MKTYGFTLFEMMVVLCIIGVIAGLALPQYTQSVERTHRKDAENQLILIYAAQKQYAARNNSVYWGPPAGVTPEAKLADINLNLGLNILSNGMDYDCSVGSSGGASTFSCSAVRTTGPGFTVAITEAPVSTGVNPSCTGSCP